MFTIVPIIIGIGFVAFFIFFIFVIVSGLLEWNKNNHSPQLAVQAIVTGKRTHVTHHHDHSGPHHTHHTSTRYYATFQTEDGSRTEFTVTGSEYGRLAEGDRGSLTFQGTRYLGFKRDTTV